MRLSDLLASRLHDAGVRRAFGFPGGGSNLDVIEALCDAGIEWVLAHTETAAAFMACATAELTGAPGVVLVGNGPGLASVVNGVAQAALDRTPLIVISDSAAAESGHQVIDQQALLAPLVKYGATLSPEAIEAALAGAARGPVHLDMPRDSGGTEVEPAAPVPAERPPGEPTIAVSGRPVILVGLAARADPEELRALAHRIGAAVLTTYKAKGAYPEDDPRWAGIVTGAAIERPLLERADIVIGVGLDPVELIAPVDHVVGRIEGSGPGFSLDEIAETRERMLAAVRGEAADVIAAACRELPGAIIAVDAGAHMFPATMLARPRRCLISNGLASMGYAVPAALAAALERPGEPVLAFCGDGGMAYHAAELETAARLGAKLIVVVLNDSSLSLIRIKQEARGYTRSPLSFGPTDFAALAEAYGVRGVRADTPDEVGAAVRAADRATVIDARISGGEYAGILTTIRG